MRKVQFVIDFDDLVGHQLDCIEVYWINLSGVTNKFIVFLTLEVGIVKINMNNIEAPA